LFGGEEDFMKLDIFKPLSNVPVPQYPYLYLYETLELYKIPNTAPWTQTAKAAGGR
jgi:hypothetical protein